MLFFFFFKANGVCPKKETQYVQRVDKSSAGDTAPELLLLLLMLGRSTRRVEVEAKREKVEELSGSYTFLT